MKIVELLPGKRIVWQVADNYFYFIKNQNERINTTIPFSISPKRGKTEIRLTHEGLVPADECYDVCSNAWDTSIDSSLKNLIVKERVGRMRRNNSRQIVDFAVDLEPSHSTMS